MGKVPPKACI